jgi:hypothetical protein
MGQVGGEWSAAAGGPAASSASSAGSSSCGRGVPQCGQGSRPWGGPMKRPQVRQTLAIQQTGSPISCASIDEHESAFRSYSPSAEPPVAGDRRPNSRPGPSGNRRWSGFLAARLWREIPGEPQSRRGDSNPGPLHYERTLQGKSPITRRHRRSGTACKPMAWAPGTRDTRDRVSSAGVPVLYLGGALRPQGRARAQQVIPERAESKGHGEGPGERRNRC